MESAEKDCSVLENLFQTIISDLRLSSPIWEDFTYKATKLHQCLKTTLGAIGSFLDAFQKVADMATNSKGATKEIGSALTRLCMRHKNIETCLKALTSSILDSLVAPLQEKLEDWKKVVAQLDKDHAKEYKKARHEIKKAASDTMRLQKKVKKGVPMGKNEMQSKLDVAMQDVNAKYQLLEVTEKNSVRTALIEERSRFCLFISCIKPFVDHEVHLLTEVTHLQEIMYNLCLQASDPHSLPDSSEQVIADLKGMDPALLSLQGRQHPSPPSSPVSLGSRKSSVCSINSINSSSSTGSSKSHSPSHTIHKHAASQPPAGAERLTSVSSQDSGFTSQDTLFVRPSTPQSLRLHQGAAGDRDSTGTDTPDCDSTPTTPSVVTTPTPSICSTDDLPIGTGTITRIERNRPHTISAGSEKAYVRLPLKPELFEPLPEKAELSEGGESQEGQSQGQGQSRAAWKARSSSMYAGSQSARSAAGITKMQPVLPPLGTRPKVKAVPPPALPPGAQPVYANTAELQKMVMENKAREEEQQRKEAEASSATAGPGSGPHNKSALKACSDDTARDALDLEEALRSLDSVTAALGTEVEEEEEKGAVILEAPRAKDVQQEDIEKRSSQSQKQNSIELAAAIRELEESTAALQSTYDTDSHNSLQCSSGYATMNSTPSGSEDTIASGDLELSSVLHDSEKYFTLPRSGAMKGALRAVVCPKRPASTAGVPASGNSLTRRSSVNTPKPPPPVRRTASISSSPMPVRASPARQLSEGGTVPGTGSQGEGAYAELQVIQQSIQQMKKSQQHPVPAPKPGHLQRQHSGESPYQQPHLVSSPSPDRASISSGSSAGSGGHYAVPNITSPGSAALIQTLNAKFASLNQQYRDPQYQQMSDGTYVGHGGSEDPDAADLMPPPAHPPDQQRNQKLGKPGVPLPPPPGSQGQQQQARSTPQFVHDQRGPSVSLPPNSHPHRMSRGEDFPLPPTAEELEEMETLYARPPPITPKPKLAGNLMMELKKRMSAEESSDV